MRAVIRKAQGQQQLLRSSNQGDMYCATVNSGGPVPYLSHLPNYGNSLTNGSSFSGGDFSNLASRMCNKPSDATDSANFSKTITTTPKLENQKFSHSNPSSLNPDNSNNSNEPAASPSNASNNSDSFPSSLERSKISVSSNLLQNGSSNNQFQTKRHANTMLMSMLSDVPSANSSSSSFPFLGQSEGNPSSSGKSRKRKKKSDNRSPGSSGRSPKRKLSEDDCRSTPDAELCDSPMGYDASSMPASLPSSSGEPMSRSLGSVDFIKTEPPSPDYPQRSTSTDSYLLHDEFQSRQLSNVNDSGLLNEAGAPVSTDILRNVTQVKSQYFGSDNMADYEKDFLGSESNYCDQSNSGDIESTGGSPFNMDCSQGSLTSKFNSEKALKKKKSKEKSDNNDNSDMLMSKVHDNPSSDESSVGDASQKSFGEADNTHSEDLSSISSKSSSSHISQPIFISTSLKIAKSGDGHKVSKSEIKIKQKDSKRSSSSGVGAESSGKRKSDAKKERKRKKTEGSESGSGRSPVRSLHLNLDSSLMPPPSSSSESNTMVSSSEAQPIRPITLNVKNSPVVTSSSNFRSKSPVHSKKSSSLGSVSGSLSKSNTSKSGSSDKNVKPSPPRSSHSPSSKSGTDSESRRSSGSVKIPSKHKQSSGSKSSSSGSNSALHGSGHSSPNKTKTLKLKNYGFPSSVTLAPLITKATIGSPTSSHNVGSVTTSDPQIMQATLGNPGSPPSKSGSNSSKANKSALRTRKGSLSAVIDKLRNTANAQHVIPDGMDPALARSELMVDRKESKLERKDNCKELRDNLSLSKGSEGKSKYSSSEQFVVKQSSQGIKLTVTKTRSSDGSSKSKYKQSSKNSSSVSSSGSGVKSSSSSSGSSSKSGNVSPASKKLYPSSSVNISMSKSSNSSSGKPNSSNPQKTSSPSHLSSSMSPRSGIPANSLSKSLSKHVSSSSQNKISGSSPKVLDKIEKKSGDGKTLSSESKDKVSTSTINVVTSLMPPPSSKQSSDSSRSSSSGNTPKRVEESSRQSPRHTPTREITIDESDGERAFRLLLSQSKIESSNGAEQSNIMVKSSEFITSAIDYSKIDILKKADADDKSQWVSSSSDIKPSSVQRSMKEALMLDDTNCISMNEIDCKSGIQIEVSSSGKHDMVVNANIVTSSEEISKAIAPLSKPIKQSKRPNGPSDEDSSPDECLVIDYPDTPRLQINEEKWSSPRIDTNILNVLEDKIDKSDFSTSNFSVNQQSLIKSPAQVLTPSNHSLTRPLSMIDDDLMNEAVMPIEK